MHIDRCVRHVNRGNAVPSDRVSNYRRSVFHGAFGPSVSVFRHNYGRHVLGGNTVPRPSPAFPLTLPVRVWVWTPSPGPSDVPTPVGSESNGSDAVRRDTVSTDHPSGSWVSDAVWAEDTNPRERGGRGQEFEVPSPVETSEVSGSSPPLCQERRRTVHYGRSGGRRRLELETLRPDPPDSRDRTSPRATRSALTSGPGSVGAESLLGTLPESTEKALHVPPRSAETPGGLGGTGRESCRGCGLGWEGPV